MATVPSRIADRLSNGIKRFQPILESARVRDVNESDTVIIVTDMLCEVFGYDKYSEVTSEFSIRGTYCDLATKVDGQIQSLIEVKAVGSELKDAQIKQAIDYAANQGIDWAVLTNGIQWKIYKVVFGKPIEQELVVDLNFLGLNARSSGDLEMVFLLAREAWAKSLLGDYHSQRQALSRFFVGAMLLAEPVLNVVRRELRRLSPDVKITSEQIAAVLEHEVIKRDVLEGEKAIEARKRVNRTINRAKRAVAKAEASAEGGPALAPTTPAPPTSSSAAPAS